MAKSKARKKRDHIQRTTGRDMTLLRSAQTDFSTHERTTKTKKEAQKRLQNKHKKRFLHDKWDEGIAFHIFQGCHSPILTYV
ncbi:hypothetical protein GCM10008967_07520 [Bacillus carboniphilus]|uniref:YqkK n=1 Tax=Bacillus carboniphilus TaxID=86663 RepID=A0ABN0VX11_9BACI